MQEFEFEFNQFKGLVGHLQGACPKLTALELTSVDLNDACLRALQPLNLSELSFMLYEDYGDEDLYMDEFDDFESAGSSLWGSWNLSLVSVENNFHDWGASPQKRKSVCV